MILDELLLWFFRLVSCSVFLVLFVFGCFFLTGFIAGRSSSSSEVVHGAGWAPATLVLPLGPASVVGTADDTPLASAVTVPAGRSRTSGPVQLELSTSVGAHKSHGTTAHSTCHSQPAKKDKNTVHMM